MCKSEKRLLCAAGLAVIGSMLTSSVAMAATVTEKECNAGGGVVIIRGNVPDDKPGARYCSGGTHGGAGVQGLRAGKKPPIGKGGDADVPAGGKAGSAR